ncbi:YkvA family protein [Myceligenerans indicum]|uniref:YkvA family protein n=1 Tax=Myceligenerans indicum TaxID=2593663 RepID=UPI00191E995D|nr:YkvA family protein [Myceligenerans indicum]
MNWKQIIALAASIGTIASPIDLIPDAIPILGLSDDAVAVVVAGYTLYKAIKAFRAARLAKAAGSAAKGAADAAKGAAGTARTSPTGAGTKIIANPGDLPGRRRK